MPRLNSNNTAHSHKPVRQLDKTSENSEFQDVSSMGSMEEVSRNWQKASAYRLWKASARWQSHKSRDMHASGKFQEVSSTGSMEEGSKKGQKASAYKSLWSASSSLHHERVGTCISQ